MPLRLYDYAASGNCYKPRLLLAQLERPYERVAIDIFGGETLTDEYARINPGRTVPVLETDDGRFLPESGAILLYLADGTPFLPDDRFGRAQVVRWLTYEQTDVIPAIAGLRFRLQTKRFTADSPDALSRKKWAGEVLQLLESHLDGREFFVGDSYSVADIALFGYLHVADEAGIELEPYERVRDWLARVRETPRYMNDLEPYPPNATAGAGRSTYD
jgi:glutathione S-transferase